MIRALAALAILSAPAAMAQVLDGAIVAQDGSGRFVRLDHPPLAVGQDIFDSPDLIAFDEAQAVVLPGALRPDVGGLIPAGRIVALHSVVFDGTGGRQRGWVRFGAPILGLANTDATLAATDALGVLACCIWAMICAVWNRVIAPGSIRAIRRGFGSIGRVHRPAIICG
jgi:hypothetical protein